MRSEAQKTAIFLCCFVRGDFPKTTEKKGGRGKSSTSAKLAYGLDGTLGLAWPGLAWAGTVGGKKKEFI